MVVHIDGRACHVTLTDADLQTLVVERELVVERDEDTRALWIKVVAPCR